MSWIFLAAGAQLINAVVAITDKYLVTDEKALPKPLVYAFYTCLVTSFWLVIYFIGIIPGLDNFGFPQFANVKTPSIQVVGMSFLAAYTFFMAVISLYDSLKRSDASDVMPVVGAISAITSFGLSWLFLNATHSPHFFWGIMLLATGTFFVSHLRFTTHLILSTLHSGIFFALHYITMKGLFQETSFDNGFFWSRVAFVLFAFSLLLVPNYVQVIFSHTKNMTKSTGFLVFTNKILAGVASFMILKATDWGDVAVVQALDGLKFVFILLISIMIGHYLPKSAGENTNDTETVFRKFVYVTIICIGFAILFT